VTPNAHPASFVSSLDDPEAALINIIVYVNTEAITVTANDASDKGMKPFHTGCWKSFSRKANSRRIAPVESVVRCRKYSKKFFWHGLRAVEVESLAKPQLYLIATIIG